MDVKSHGRSQADRRKRHAFVVSFGGYLYMVQSCHIVDCSQMICTSWSLGSHPILRGHSLTLVQYIVLNLIPDFKLVFTLLLG